MKPFGHSISHELVSATSALNTEVTYSGPHRTEDDDFVWLPDAEPLVLHSQEHIASAIDIATELRRELDKVRTLIYKLEPSFNQWMSIDKALRAVENRL